MPRFAPGLQFDPGFSATLCGFVAVTHGAALLACPLAGWQGWIRAGCALAVIGSAAMSCDRYLRRPQVRSLRRVADGSWHVTLRDGSECACRLAGDTLVTQVFALLSLSSASGTWRVPIFRDSLDAEAYRQLRVALRVCGPSAGDRRRDDRAG